MQAMQPLVPSLPACQYHKQSWAGKIANNNGQRVDNNGLAPRRHMSAKAHVAHNKDGRGSCPFVPTNCFLFWWECLFLTLWIWKKLERQATERSRLFNMTVKMIANPVNHPGAMPTIFLEISQFGDPHATLNHFQRGVTIFNLWFWLISGCFLKKPVSAVMPTKIQMTTFSSLAPPVLRLPARVLQRRQHDWRQGIFLNSALCCSGW
jgi:hypothetical protein